MQCFCSAPGHSPRQGAPATRTAWSRIGTGHSHGPWCSHGWETFPATAAECKAAPNKQSGFEVHHHMVNSLFWNLLLLKILSDIQGRKTSWKSDFSSNSGKCGCLQSQRDKAPLARGEARASPKAQLHKHSQLSNPTYQLLVPAPRRSPYTAKHGERARLKFNFLHPFWWQCQVQVFVESKC